MLVLERKIQQGFWVGDQIFVKVLDISRGRVRIGIQAPSDAHILRDELLPSDIDAALVVKQPTTLGPTGTTAELKAGTPAHRNDQRAASPDLSGRPPAPSPLLSI